MESAVDATDNPTDADSGANQDLLAATFPINTTNLRRDFVDQAKRIKDLLVIGKTPERVENPKNTYTLDAKGNLKGEMELVKETGEAEETPDLVKRAEAVNEGMEKGKKLIFKKKSSMECDGSKEIIKDERESEDKQPKEAVACEARFPKFNKREQDLISAGNPAAVRQQMRDGSLAKARGRQILYTMGATEEDESVEDVFTTAPADAGASIESEEEFVPAACACLHGQPLIGAIDTEIGDEFGCDVKYTSMAPVTGQIIVMDADTAKKIGLVLESFGVKSHTVAAKEEFAVLFQEEEVLPVTTWYALISDKINPNKVSQITLTIQDGGTEEQVKQYLSTKYSPEQIMSISKEPF